MGLMLDGTLSCADNWYSPVRWLHLLHIFSMLIAIYCIGVLGKNTRFQKDLRHHRLMGKTLLFQLFIILSKLQPMLIKQTMHQEKNGVYSKTAKQVIFNGQISVIEFFVLFLALSRMYTVKESPKENGVDRREDEKSVCSVTSELAQ